MSHLMFGSKLKKYISQDVKSIMFPVLYVKVFFLRFFFYKFKILKLFAYQFLGVRLSINSSFIAELLGFYGF